MITGVVSFFFIGLVPEDIKFVVTLFFFSSFAGILYIYYSPPIPSKNILLILFTLFIIGPCHPKRQFLRLLFIWESLYFLFCFWVKRYALWKKLLVFVIGVFLLFVVQNVKTLIGILPGEKEVDNKSSLFMDILFDKLAILISMIDMDGFFPVYMRMNQGYNIAAVMRRIPASQDFDNGSHLF